MEISIIIVNYNTKQFLMECLKSIVSWGLSFELLVVDNGSCDASSQMVEGDFPQVRLLKNEANFGFSKANNQAIVQARGEFILLLNPDTIISQQALQKMLAFIRENPKVGIVGPKILNAGGTLQLSCHMRPGPLRSYLTWVLPEIFYEKWHLFINKHPIEVGYVSGACLLIRRKTIDEIGLLDENFFMYSEEADWCMRARKAKWKVYFLPEAQILHYGGESVKKYGLTSMSEIRAKSNYLLIKKHFGRLKADLFAFLVKGLIFMRKTFWRISIVFKGKNKDELEEKLKIYNAILKGLKN